MTTRYPTILGTLRERLRVLEKEQGQEPEFIPVSREELRDYVLLYENIDLTFSTDDAGRVLPRVGDMPIYCTLRGVELRCEDAGS